MYGILGEEDDDAETIKVLVRRLSNAATLKCRLTSFGGFGGLLKNGKRQLLNFAKGGCTRFVVCVDADGPDGDHRREEVMAKVIRPSGIATNYCVVIPVQEIEAWILADIEAVSNVFTGWNPSPIRENPEGISNPKERLKSVSRTNNRRPRYDPATHNPKVADHLDIVKVRRRCKSFEHLVFFITGRAITAGMQ